MRVAPLLFALAAPATAQDWVSLGGPPALPSGLECSIRFVTPTPIGPAVTTPCGVYRHESGRWIRLGVAGPSSLGVAGDGTLYGLVPDEEVLHYDDDSDTWSPFTDGLLIASDEFPYVLSGLVVEANGSLWVSAYSLAEIGESVGGLYHAPDGRAWTRATGDDQPDYLFGVLPDGRLAGYSSSCELDPPCSLASHIGRPESWTLGGPDADLEEAWGFETLTDLAEAPTSTEAAFVASLSGGLIRSDDGETWERTDFGSGGTGYAVFDLLTLPAQRSVLSATSDGLFRSSDGGVSWALVATSSDEGGQIRDLAVDDTGVVFVVGNTVLDGVYELFRSTYPLSIADDIGDSSRPSLRIGPNPVAHGATVFYEVPKAGRVQVEVFDVMGRSMGRVLNEARPAGAHEARLPSLPPGVYVVRLQTEESVESVRVSVVR